MYVQEFLQDERSKEKGELRFNLSLLSMLESICKHSTRSSWRTRFEAIQATNADRTPASFQLPSLSRVASSSSRSSHGTDIRLMRCLSQRRCTGSRYSMLYRACQFSTMAWRCPSPGRLGALRRKDKELLPKAASLES